jgi:hypothetical protein
MTMPFEPLISTKATTGDGLLAMLDYLCSDGLMSPRPSLQG